MGKNKKPKTHKSSLSNRILALINRSSGRTHLLALIAAVLCLLILIPLVEFLTRGYYQQLLVDERTRVIQEFKPIQYGFETGLKTGEALTESLSAFAITQLISEGKISSAEFNNYADSFQENIAGINAFTLAPDGIIEMIHPGTTGEFRKGYNWFISEFSADLESVKNETSGNARAGQTIIMRVGETTIAIHQPIYLYNKFWGFASILLDLNTLLKNAGLTAQVQQTYQVALLSEGNQIAFGDGNILNQDAMVLTFSAPANDWRLAVLPINGWGATSKPNYNLVHVISLVCAFLISILIYSGINHQINLTRIVQDRTRDLTLANQSALMLSQCNEILVRAQTEDEILENICQKVHDLGKYPLVWVGLLDDRYPGLIIPKAVAGGISSTLELPALEANDPQSEIHTSRLESLSGRDSKIISDFREEAIFNTWLNKEQLREYKSLLLLPLMDAGTPFGVLAIHDPHLDRFTADQRSLLNSLSNDLAFGLIALRTRLAKHAAENALRKERDMFSRLMETSPSGVLVADRSNRIIFSNSRAKEILGITSDLASEYSQYIHLWRALDEKNNPIPGAELPYARIVRSKEPLLNYQLRLETNNDELLWILVNGAPLLDSDGEVEAVILTLEDITFSKTSELALSESEKRYRQLVETIHDGIWMFDSTFTTIFGNQFIAEMLGYKVEELQGKSIYDFMTEFQRESFKKDVPRLRQGQPMELDVEFIHREGRLVITSIHTAPLLDEKHHWMGVLAIVSDITARRLKERELEAITRMANALRDAITREDVIRIMLDTMMGFYKGQAAALAVRNAITNEIEFEIGRGLWDDWEYLSHPSLNEVSMRVLDTAKPYLSLHAQEDPNLAFPDLLEGVQTIICLPLITHEKTIGAVWLGKNQSTGTQFFNPTGEEVRLLMAAADIAASAMQRAILLSQTQTRANRLSAQRDINLTISSSLNVQTVLDKLIKHVTSKLDVAAAAILLYNQDAQTLEYAVGRGLDPRPAYGAPVDLQNDYAGRAIQSQQIIHVSRATDLKEGFDRSWKSSLKGFHHYEAIPLISKGQPKGIMELFYRTPPTTDPEWADFLSSMATQVAVTLDNVELFEKLNISNIELTTAYDATIEGWSKALELRDQEIEGHAQRVVDLTLKLAMACGIPEEELVHVRRGALLHDIGKMAIPDSILFKKGPLTIKEIEIMKMHPVFAKQLLHPIAYLRPAVDIPYCHHERWDGKGYPQGLKGEEIPIFARIFMIVDVWDALRSDRPYRGAWREEKVRAHIARAAGKRFDPEIVNTFLTKVLEKPGKAPR